MGGKLPRRTRNTQKVAAANQSPPNQVQYAEWFGNDQSPRDTPAAQNNKKAHQLARFFRVLAFRRFIRSRPGYARVPQPAADQ